MLRRMPRIEGALDEQLREVWVYSSRDEARDLLTALAFWDEEDPKDPEWRHRVGALPDAELIIAVEAWQRCRIRLLPTSPADRS
jgi:hypothetical protein